MAKSSDPESIHLEPKGTLFSQVSHTQIRSFHAVASAAGFTAASKILNMEQPTITEQVRSLEEFFLLQLPLDQLDGLGDAQVFVGEAPLRALNGGHGRGDLGLAPLAHAVLHVLHTLER